MITGLILGFVAGAICMLLICMNSPEHLMKWKGWVKKGESWVKSK